MMAKDITDALAVAQRYDDILADDSDGDGPEDWQLGDALLVLAAHIKQSEWIECGAQKLRGVCIAEASQMLTPDAVERQADRIVNALICATTPPITRQERGGS